MYYIDCRFSIENFQEVKDLLPLFANNRIVLYRKKEVEAAYQVELKRYKDNNIDYSQELLQNDLKDKDYLLEPDKFPVNLPDDTQNWVFWIKNNNVSDEEIFRLMDQEIAAKGWLKSDTIYFEKLPINQSVPLIRHFHVYVKVQ